ncbi:hypothetical protein [Streptomyces sp. NPDC002134]|uniref:RapZ C-terminal domain-containing protein n=1 Tax=Streptomyces sp. NPDC002134 TaxID=3364632 RepID=UPI0036CDB0D1
MSPSPARSGLCSSGRSLTTRDLLANLIDYAELPAGPQSIAVGCSGGRPRTCGIVEILAQRLRDNGREVEVSHHHAHLPRVLKRATS